MNSKNPKKWEQLLNDSEFELRLVRQTKARIRTERIKRKVYATLAACVTFFCLVSYNEFVLEPSELTTNLHYLVEELSSESIVSLSMY
ncbi:hypothetical protein ND861_08515 [Leptospira sp. 2 VSF19]|uniref:Uncharacterized protein n=1 Tax=Leptospira soteropolitanensis TaxID=2950025 RepID=A0AAW5VMN7_9LEPT|nr:hypothetical protein [Leptospira soteropolitanensis]MCW7492757.1 hypothetical protein [Leptospira soteropolitanensis]MCW7500440.1 hypothetical protein [Leptospira soteropolitanensis]MCW7522525.1 hypothetical protein [Leptospira soteropolitanensis]MCW7526381.1 hypothetical protein [Leptospira soteropolitanensis]MCW7530410.1 hypothetical protein [Leptospira soteropolitanensis]